MQFGALVTASFFCGLHTTFGTLFQTLYGTSTQIRDKTKPCRPQSGLSRAPAPTFIPAVSTAAKSLSPFAGVTLYKDIEKAVQSFTLRHRFVLLFTAPLYIFPQKKVRLHRLPLLLLPALVV